MTRSADQDADAVVVGGGIAGLAAAFALARTGRPVRVLEQAPDLGETGFGIQLAANATRILRDWGLLDEIADRGVLPRRAVLRDAVDGTELTHVDLHDAAHRHGSPYVLVGRNTLHTILRWACRGAGVELITDTTVTDVQHSTGGPTGPGRGRGGGPRTAGAVAVSSDGRRYRGQIVLAADGRRSRLRRHLSLDEPRDTGYVAYRSVLPTTEVDTADLALNEALDEMVLSIGPGYHLVQYPLDRGESYNHVAVLQPPPPDGRRPGDPSCHGLDEVFAHSCAPVRNAVQYLNRDRCWPVRDRDPITNWVDRRLTLIGDAAHPMLQYFAQGACQALEDADHLAHAVTTHADSDGWDRALKAYADTRTPRTTEIQQKVRTWGELLHADGLLRDVRNTLLRDRDPTDYRHVDWLHDPTPIRTAEQTGRP